MDFSITELIIIVAAGGGIGWIAGLFGVGGGFLLVPVMNILLGIPVEYAVGASACQVLGPATTALLARRVKWRSFHFPLTVAGGLFIGVTAGTLTFRSLDNLDNITLWGQSVEPAQISVLLVYLFVMLGVGLFSIWETKRSKTGHPVSVGWLANWNLPPLVRFREFEGERMSLPIVCWFGAGIGLVSGLLGMSGGLILIPGLVYLLGMKVEKAILPTLAIVWMISFQATVVHAWNGYVDLKLVAALLVGGTFGAQLGARTGQQWGGTKLRERFGWLLLTSAALIAFKLFRIFTDSA
jgi:uncharacterized membrane protein YfcA